MPRGKISRKKRGTKEGSIYTRKVRNWTYWVYQVTLPDGTQSKPKYCKTEAEAIEGVRELSHSISMGYTPTDITFTEWAMQWLKTKNVKGKTMTAYQSNIRHLDKYVGGMKLDKLQPSNLEVAYRGLMDSGLSDSSVNQIHRTAKNLLRAAFNNGVITRNLGTLAKAPSSKKRDPVILSREERIDLFDAADEEDDGLLVRFLAETGLRVDVEALETKWEQIDFKTKTLTVGKSKTEAGENREINLEEELLERLKARQEGQAAQLDPNDPYKKKAFNPNGYVFCNAEGNRHSLTNLTRRMWKRVKGKADIDPRMTFHDLRHNYGSYLLSEGISIPTVSNLMGHSNVAITLNIYSHQMKEDMSKVRTAIQRMT